MPSPQYNRRAAERVAGSQNCPTRNRWKCPNRIDRDTFEKGDFRREFSAHSIAKVARKAAKQRVQDLGENSLVIRELAPPLGVMTAAVLVVKASDPRSVASMASYSKAQGLNLKVRSCGQHKGQLKITKRG